MVTSGLFSTSSTARGRVSFAARLVATLGALALVGVALVAVMPAAPAAAAVSTQCNGVANGGGEGLECEVTVENTLNVATGVASSLVTTIECVGMADSVTCGLPVATPYSELTTSVDQCNGSANGGGATLRCSITVINTITGAVTTSTAPINQCVGSFVGTGRACDPDSATEDASVNGLTQCNGTGNDTSVSMTCTVTASTTSSNSAFNFLANQCNGSSNGNGALTVCTVNMSTVVLPADTGGGGGNDGGGTGGGAGGGTLPNTGADTGLALGIAALLLAAGAAALAMSRRRWSRAAG